MRERILTCKHHTNLRWATKPEAWSGFYNQSRNIFFLGSTPCEADPDNSGITCERARECDCALNDLILAPEDSDDHEVWGAK